MLHNFLLTYRTEILALCTAKLLSVSDSKITSNEMDQGLPVFYDELIEVLRADENDAEVITNQVADRLHHGSAMKRGKESFKLGYTISQVVHGYGALCQSITEFAANHSEQIIVAREFNRLNFCLDVAIAEAVTEFSKGQSEQFAQAEVQRLGFLAHEMRNALNNMATAYHMIKEGLVGFAGSTSQILENALGRMSDIIDRSLSEVRLRGEPAVDLHRSRVVDMIGEVEATAVFNAAAKSIKLHVEVEPDLIVSVDHHLMVSALSNLVQNAIKFTAPGRSVWIRGTANEHRVFIEVQDACGGLQPGKIDELFQPYVQRDVDKSGVGLGLSIASRAVSLNDGQLSARDVPGIGCIFTIDLPRVAPLENESEGQHIPIQ